MANRFLLFVAAAVVGFTSGGILMAAPPVSAEQVVTCESNNRQRNTCRVDTRYGVRLLRQLSDTRCRGNWGFDRNRIWVRNGCRAQFLVGNNRDDRNNRRDRYDRDDRYNRRDRYDRDDRYNRRDRYDRNDRYNRPRR